MEYEGQVEDFLNRNEISICVKRLDTKKPYWDDGQHGPRWRYEVTLCRPSKDYWSFEFWGSIADCQKGKDISAYNVLACLASDSYYKDVSPHELSLELGIPLDYARKAVEFSELIVEFFDDEQLEELRTFN